MKPRKLIFSSGNRAIRGPLNINRLKIKGIYRAIFGPTEPKMARSPKRTTIHTSLKIWKPRRPPCIRGFLRRFASVRATCKHAATLFASARFHPPQCDRPVSVPGANSIPRNTSANFAVRSTANCSCAAVVALVLFNTSRTATSRFGSAPTSSLTLTVDVIAQIVTVPSRSTRPFRLRRPVTELLPVGQQATEYG